MTGTARLEGLHVLVVEDEYLLAQALVMALRAQGVKVIGPASTVQAALALLDDEAGAGIDAAILDVNLGGEPVFPVADRVLAAGKPVIFTTGYDISAIPSQYWNETRCEKPYTLSAITEVLCARAAKSSIKRES